MIPTALCALALGAVFGYLARHLRVLSWAAAHLAPALDAGWFVTAQTCSGCGRRAHLMRAARPGEHLCVWSCGALYAAQIASDRTETGKQVPLRELMQAEVPGGAPGRSGPQEGTTITEGNERMQTPTAAIIGDRIEHELMPGFTMLVEESEPCETDCNRPEPHRQYQITDPEGNADWLCAYDVRKVG